METPCWWHYPVGITPGFKPTYKEWKQFSQEGQMSLRSICFKPTYKEWKPSSSILSISGRGGVLSLPTRNGNRYLRQKYIPLIRVLSLPTRNGNDKIFEFEDGFRHPVLSLPTRNGNGEAMHFRELPHVVLSLPTRNGNWSGESLPQIRLCSFKPTYKEWKQAKGDPSRFGPLSF